MAHDVFISYASDDKRIADSVCASLEAAEIRCWIAPRDITPGTDWSAAIVDAIESSRVCILVFSAHANESAQIEREVERAVNHGNAVIPFRIEDIQPSKTLEYFISSAHWLDAITPPVEQHIDRLGSAVKELIREPKSEFDKGDSNSTIATTQSVSRTKKASQIPLVVGGLVLITGLVCAPVLILNSLDNGDSLPDHNDVSPLIDNAHSDDEPFESTSETSVDSLAEKLNKLEDAPSLDVATSLTNLAGLYEAQGKYKDAEGIWRRVLAMREQLLGNQHPVYAQTLQSVARLHVRAGRPKLAEPLQTKAVAINRVVLGDYHPDTATSLNVLGAIYLELADYKRAAPLIDQALKIRMSSLGDDDPDMVPILENLARVYAASGDATKAKAVAARLASLKERFGLEDNN